MQAETLERIRIGGADQWVLERSGDLSSPVVLYLHGGPGTSQLTLNRRNTRDLERCFTVVNWDQRGAEKLYAAIRDTGAMNIDQFVEDTRELTLYLLQKFGKERLVRVGHSWAAQSARSRLRGRRTCLRATWASGRSPTWPRAEVPSYRWVLDEARRRHHRRALRSLERIGPPPYKGDWLKKTVTERTYVARFGGEVRASRLGAIPMLLRNVGISSEYTLRDRVNYVRGIRGSMRALWSQLLAVNLFEQVPGMGVPVFFMEGRHDWEVPSVLSARYYEALSAPFKRLIWFENSAHLPNAEEREHFNQIMRDDVREVALDV